MALPHLCFIIETGTDVRLVEGLAERFNLTLLARQSKEGVTISQPTAVPITTIVEPASRSKFALFVWNYLKQQREKFDYVLLQGYGLSAIAANLASRFTGTPTAMLVCSPVEAYYYCRKAYPMPDKPFRWYEIWSFQAIARINALIGQHYLVLSQYLADVVRSHGGRKPVTIVPIYGVDTHIFVPSSEPKPEIKARSGLPTTGSIIFFSSRIAPEKDSETLLLAFQRLLREGRDLWLLHRSGGYQAFIKEAEQYGLAERVIATDAVHPHRQLPLDYQACDLCVQSSRQEGLGFSPLEALACGVPVIASAVGGLRETIIDGQTGWTYPVGDSDALARCIEEVLDNPVEAARRACAGRDLVCTKYDQRIVFEQLLKIMQTLSENQT
jgi:glycosyltransferase involved in cell wall biosynthesis